MSAVSQKLGCSIVSDMPPEVDPGLAALVNLLNDRATDKARQLLASRLNHIPYSGRTNITSLMTRAYFPIMMMRYGFKREISGLDDCTSREQFAAIYDYLSERFQEPDGSGFFAAGCATLTAALKTDDPAKQDLMALAAASQLVSFEMGLGWVELLQILDYIVGIEDVPYADHDVTFAKYGKYFLEAEAPAETDNANRPFEKVYDFGIKVLWFPALVEKFSDRLEEIAGQILDEVADLESVELYMHRFSFEDEEVMIATSWDEELNILSADADLVAYQDVVGEIDLDGDGDASPLLVPVPASAAETIH